MDSAERSAPEETTMTKETAIFDLPPAPPALVEVYEEYSAAYSREVIAVLRSAEP